MNAVMFICYSINNAAAKVNKFQHVRALLHYEILLFGTYFQRHVESQAFK